MKNVVINIMFCILLIMFFGGLYEVQDSDADQASPRIHTLTQPDGTTFLARQWGDERMHGWDTTEQYAIIQNQQGYWTYAVRDVSGWFTPTAFVVGKDDPASQGIPKHLRPFFRSAGIPMNIQVVLLMNFSDTMIGVTPTSFYTRWFGPDAPPDPLTEWSRLTQSHSDKMKSIPDRSVSVTGWYPAAHPHAYYGEDVTDNQGKRIRDRYVATLVIEAVQAADTAVDFGRYDMNGDCYVDLVMVVHQGPAQEDTKNPDDLFSLEGTLNDEQANGDGTGEVTTNDQCNPDMLMKINAYAIQPETRSLLQ